MCAFMKLPPQSLSHRTLSSQCSLVPPVDKPTGLPGAWDRHWSAFCHPSFASARISCKWNHSVQHPMNGASMDNMEIGEEKLSKEKAMEPHSSTLAWKLPWMREPGRLRSMGSLRVWHNWATSLSLFTFMHWRRKWQPIPVFLPGESQGRGSLVGCYLWGRTELDTTEAT